MATETQCAGRRQSPNRELLSCLELLAKAFMPALILSNISRIHQMAELESHFSNLKWLERPKSRTGETQQVIESQHHHRFLLKFWCTLKTFNMERKFSIALYMVWCPPRDTSSTREENVKRGSILQSVAISLLDSRNTHQKTRDLTLLHIYYYILLIIKKINSIRLLRLFN